MKKTLLIISFGTVLFSCKNEKKDTVKNEEKTEISNSKTKNDLPDSGEFNWESVPDLQNIGNFPFFTAPAGLKISNEKDGLSEIFEYETMQNFLGNSVYTTEGKLGVINFESASDIRFNQKLFDKSIYSYIDNIGGKKLYQGDFPQDEKQKAQLEKNLWTGKNGTSGLLRESDAPFAVYAFKNNGKKYMVNIQSNAAQGSIFVMELQDFVNTVKK